MAVNIAAGDMDTFRGNDKFFVDEISSLRVVLARLNQKGILKDDKVRAALIAGCDREKVTILLSHRPELLKTYAANGVDLVLTGHAHGGQVRLPFIGPIYSPSQGLFPKLTSGLYREGETQMFVSRGIGNGIAPYRFNDGPELAVLVLEPA